MRLLVAILAVCTFGSIACVDLQQRLQYDSLDEVTMEATGQPLWELELANREIEQVKEKLWKTKTKSLYCIRDNAEARSAGPRTLSEVQERRRSKNIKVLMKLALNPVIEMRESEAKRQLIRDGCNTR